MGCCKFISVGVALFAIFMGTVYSGLITKTGVFRYVDEFEGSRGQFMKGMCPPFHEGTPWGFSEAQMPDLKGHVSIVTGANTGLGFWTAYHLANAGASVVLGCRSASKCAAAEASLRIELGQKGAAAVLVPLVLDLSSFQSIRAFAPAFTSQFESLDSLVLNAGVMVPPFRTTAEGLELQIGTNHFGHHLLTKLLLPTLETTAAAKGVATVVAVSSAAHFDSYPEGIRLSVDAMNDEASYDRAKAYGQSKLANVLFAQELSQRVQDKAILVNSIHPGGVDTELSRHITEAITRFCGERISDFFKDNLMPGAGRGLWHPKDAALTQVFAAVAPSLIAAKTTGKYFHPIARETKPDLHAFNSTLQSGLWDLTEAFIATH